MLDLTRELRAIAGALDATGAVYALAGGLAVSIYATPRATQDIDLLLAVADLDRATAALGALGFRLAGRPMRVASGRLQIQRLIKIEGPDLLPVDLLLPQDDELATILTSRTAITWDETRLWIVSLPGLRALKQLRGSRGAGTGLSMTSEQVAARLATVSALRTLGSRLPHLGTPAEAARLERFWALVPSPERATADDIEALATGWAAWWRHGRVNDLAEMARRVDATLIDSDRRLASFAAATS